MTIVIISAVVTANAAAASAVVVVVIVISQDLVGPCCQTLDLCDRRLPQLSSAALAYLLARYAAAASIPHPRARAKSFAPRLLGIRFCKLGVLAAKWSRSTTAKVKLRQTGRVERPAPKDLVIPTTSKVLDSRSCRPCTRPQAPARWHSSLPRLPPGLKSMATQPLPILLQQ